MSDELADLILRAARELRECAASGEHPAAAALAALRRASGRCLAEAMYGRAAHEWYCRLTGLVGGCEEACRVYPVDAGRVGEVMLPELSRRLGPLAAEAGRVREAQACGC